MSRLAFAILLACSRGLSAADDAELDGTGSVRGRILFEGAVPKLAPLVDLGGKRSGADVKDALCFVNGVPDESLVVDPKTRGVANVFVYLRRRPDGMPEALRAPPREPVRVTTTGGRLQPHAVFARVEQPIVCSHADDCSHNLHDFPLKNEVVGFLLPPGSPADQRFVYEKSEILPIQVKCDIHAWMIGYWLILDHPYAAITDAGGRFQIAGLPPGKHSFRVWHERAGWLERSLEVEVQAGETTNVGTRSYAADVFE